MPNTSQPSLARAPFWADATFHTTSNVAQREFSINKPLFVSPPSAGRKITAGFSWMRRISRGTSMDVWFPDALREELDALVASGGAIGPGNFPAEWAAVRQFELLQEAGNYKVYDLNAGYLSRTLVDLMRSMRAGGYSVTVVTIGSYAEDENDDLEILDKRLQDRIARLTHMLYMEEESKGINTTLDRVLAEERWDYRHFLPQVGLALGEGDLFRPAGVVVRPARDTMTIPSAPHRVTVADVENWTDDLGVVDAKTGRVFMSVDGAPRASEYTVREGVYRFAPVDRGREVTIAYRRRAAGNGQAKPSAADTRHRLARQFFDILSLLPQKHIVHDTAVGLQLPESINEHEWLYLAEGTETFAAFNQFLSDIFTPFNRVSLSRLHGREDATAEAKPSAQHMRGYGDRLTDAADQFYRDAARYASP